MNEFDFTEVLSAPTEPETDSETTPAGDPPAENEAPFLPVKYKGKERQLTKEEATTLAQKGLNYDKIMGELESLKRAASPEGAAAEQEERGVKRWIDFFADHPQFRGYDDLPSEMRLAVASGQTPEQAWLRYENEDLKNRLSQAEQREKNRQTAPVPAKSAAAADPMDGFLKGLLQD